MVQVRYLRSKRTPYAAPVAVLAVVGLVALVPALSGASSPAGLPAQAFFEACGYKVEAILPQHTWKLDVAVMRKFLL